MGTIRKPKPLFSEKGSRCVLLLHAYSGSPYDVRMLSRFLESKNYTVYSPMFTGHGTADPLDILNQPVAAWEEDTRKALDFLKNVGYQQIAVFGLSMGGIFATRAIEWQDREVIGGGFFCSPIFPTDNQVVENFLHYAESVLKKQNIPPSEIEEKLNIYHPLLEYQLESIEEIASDARERLDNIQVPFFMAQAGQDEMIDAAGVFRTAQALQGKRFVLQWYPDSSHVITVGNARHQLEQDVYQFLNTLPWNEEKNE